MRSFKRTDLTSSTALLLLRLAHRLVEEFFIRLIQIVDIVRMGIIMRIPPWCESPTTTQPSPLPVEWADSPDSGWKVFIMMIIIVIMISITMMIMMMMMIIISMIMIII